MGKFNLKEELKEQLKHDVIENFKNKDKGGVQGANYLNMDNASYYKVVAGKNAIDIIPFRHGTDLFRNKKKGSFSYLLDVHIHKNFNQSFDKCICMQRTFGLPCAICDERKRLEEEYEENIDRIKQLYPQRRALLNVVNLMDADDDDNGQIQVLDASYALFSKELSEEASADAVNGGEPVDFATPDEGKSVRFRATEETIGKKGKYFKFKSFTFTDREEPYDEGIVDYAYSDDEFDHGAFALDTMLIVPKYEEIEAMLTESPVTKEEEEDDDEEEEVPAPKARKRRKIEKESEEEEEEEDEEENDSKCPYGHTFGVDIGKTDDCATCKKKHVETYKDCLMLSIE
jgi:hypothetical protein